MVNKLKAYGYSVFLVVFYALLAVSIYNALHTDSMVSTLIADVAMICICGGSYMSLKTANKSADFLKTEFEMSWKKFFFILGAIVVFAYMNMTVMFQMSLMFQDSGDRIEAINSHSRAFYAFYSIIAAPLTEETIYRLCIYNRLKSVSHWIPSMVVSSFLFGISHMTMEHTIGATLFGVFLVLVYELSGRKLMMSIMCHMIYNTMSFFMTSNWLPYKSMIVFFLFLTLLTAMCSFGTKYIYSKRDALVTAEAAKKKKKK